MTPGFAGADSETERTTKKAPETGALCMRKDQRPVEPAVISMAACDQWTLAISSSSPSAWPSAACIESVSASGVPSAACTA